MIRGFHLADFLTLGNAGCGVLAVFAVMGYLETRNPQRLLAAAALIPVAIVAIAAWLGRIGDALPLGAIRLGPGQLHPLALLWAVSGSFMISKTLRIPKL